MFKLVIADDEGKTTVVPLVRDEVTIGRKEGNTIRLTERNVSRKHAKLRRVGASFVISDLKSYNGTRVNGRRIEGEVELKPGDQVAIGDYQLTLQHEGTTETVDTAPSATAPTAAAGSAEGPTALVAAPALAASIPPARLVMISPPAVGAEFALTRPRMRIGRAEDLEIWVNHRSISREHAEIALEGGAVFIRDLASANGVRINGVETKQGALRSGDVLELGQVRFRMVGAGEHYVVDADRTVQMEPVLGPPVQRTPLYVAAGIVVVALVVGIGVALSGGGGEAAEPRVTSFSAPVVVETPSNDPATSSADPAAPSPSAGASIESRLADAVGACQMALNAGSFAAALARANEALALRPDDPRAIACRDAATRAEAEDSLFGAGLAALRQRDFARAATTFDELPEGSSYRGRAEVREAYRGYAEELLAQAREAHDPAIAGGLAQQILALPGLDPRVQREAQAIARRASGPVAVATLRPERTPPSTAPRGPRPAPAERPSAIASPQQTTPPATSASSSTGSAADSPDEIARVCLINSDNACVIRELGGGRARTARQLAMLASAQQALSGSPAPACPTIERLLQLYPASREADRFRQIHVLHCQGR